MEDRLGVVSETCPSTTRHFRGQFYPIKDSSGKIVGLSTIWQDISEAKRAEANQKLLNMELIHRTKNLMTVVQAVAARSLHGEQSFEQARHSLLRRLDAISRACTSLTETSWRGVSLDRIIASECEEHGNAIGCDGPRLLLNASAAQSFALVMHELATNATKYGSLSVPNGRVMIRWHIEDCGGERRLQLRWHEVGGPKVQAPKRRGFGHTLLQRIMSDGNSYIASANYDVDGLIYDLDVDLEAISAQAPTGHHFQPRDILVA